MSKKFTDYLEENAEWVIKDSDRDIALTKPMKKEMAEELIKSLSEDLNLIITK